MTSTLYQLFFLDHLLSLLTHVKESFNDFLSELSSLSVPNPTLQGLRQLWVLKPTNEPNHP